MLAVSAPVNGFLDVSPGSGISGLLVTPRIYGGREGQSVDGISSVHEAVHVMFASYTRTYTTCLGRIPIRTRHTETRTRG